MKLRLPSSVAPPCTQQGKAAARLVEETVKRMLERRVTFPDGVQFGKDASRARSTVSHEDVAALSARFAAFSSRLSGIT